MELDKKNCYHCNKEIYVATVEPHPKQDKITGIHLKGLSDDCGECHLGWLCWECADNYEKLRPDLEVSFGFGGGLPPDCCVWRKQEVQNETRQS